MIVKVISSASFNSVSYVTNKKDAEILHYEHIRGYLTNKEMKEDFKLQACMNKNVEKKTLHLILSWGKNDAHKLNSEIMKERALEVLQKLGILDKDKNALSQVLLVRHHDRQEGEHMHIIINRVANDGTTINDHMIGRRCGEIAKRMNAIYQYGLTSNKDQVKRHRLRGVDKAKYQIYDSIRASLTHGSPKSFKELEMQLQFKGIEMIYKYAGKTSLVQGLSFKKGDIIVKGSQIGYSYGKLNQIFNPELLETKKEIDPIFSDRTDVKEAQEIPSLQTELNKGSDPLSKLVNTMSFSVGGSPSEDDDLYRRKRRRKR